MNTSPNAGECIYSGLCSPVFSFGRWSVRYSTTQQSSLSSTRIGYVWRPKSSVYTPYTPFIDQIMIANQPLTALFMMFGGGGLRRSVGYHDNSAMVWRGNGVGTTQHLSAHGWHRGYSAMLKGPTSARSNGWLLDDYYEYLRTYGHRQIQRCLSLRTGL